MCYAWDPRSRLASIICIFPWTVFVWSWSGQKPRSLFLDPVENDCVGAILKTTPEPHLGAQLGIWTHLPSRLYRHLSAASTPACLVSLGGWMWWFLFVMNYLPNRVLYTGCLLSRGAKSLWRLNNPDPWIRNPEVAPGVRNSDPEGLKSPPTQLPCM